MSINKYQANLNSKDPSVVTQYPVNPHLSSLLFFLLFPHCSSIKREFEKCPQSIFHQLLILFLLCYDKVMVCCPIWPTHTMTHTHTSTHKYSLS